MEELAESATSKSIAEYAKSGDSAFQQYPEVGSERMEVDVRPEPRQMMMVDIEVEVERLDEVGPDYITAAATEPPTEDAYKMHSYAEQHSQDETLYDSDPEMQMVIDEEAWEFSRIKAVTLHNDEPDSEDDTILPYMQQSAHYERAGINPQLRLMCGLCNKLWNEVPLFLEHMLQHPEDYIIYVVDVKKGSTTITSNVRTDRQYKENVLKTPPKAVLYKCPVCGHLSLNFDAVMLHMTSVHGPLHTAYPNSDPVKHSVACLSCHSVFMCKRDYESQCVKGVRQCRKCMMIFNCCWENCRHVEYNLCSDILYCPCGLAADLKKMQKHSVVCKRYLNVSERVFCPCGIFFTRNEIYEHAQHCDMYYSDVIMCIYCPSVFYKQQALKSHVESKHGCANKLYVCKILSKPTCGLCNRTYAIEYNLKLHIKHRHHKELRYQCHNCMLFFDSWDSMHSHEFAYPAQVCLCGCGKTHARRTHSRSSDVDPPLTSKAQSLEAPPINVDELVHVQKPPVSKTLEPQPLETLVHKKLDLIPQPLETLVSKKEELISVQVSVSKMYVCVFCQLIYKNLNEHQQNNEIIADCVRCGVELMSDCYRKIHAESCPPADTMVKCKFPRCSRWLAKPEFRQIHMIRSHSLAKKFLYFMCKWCKIKFRSEKLWEHHECSYEPVVSAVQQPPKPILLKHDLSIDNDPSISQTELSKITTNILVDISKRGRIVTSPKSSKFKIAHVNGLSTLYVFPKNTKDLWMDKSMNKANVSHEDTLVSISVESPTRELAKTPNNTSLSVSENISENSTAAQNPDPSDRVFSVSTDEMANISKHSTVTQNKDPLNEVLKTSLLTKFMFGRDVIKVKEEIKEKPLDCDENAEPVAVLGSEVNELECESEPGETIEDFIASTKCESEPGQTIEDFIASTSVVKPPRESCDNMLIYQRHYVEHGLERGQCPACLALFRGTELVRHVWDHIAASFGCTVGALQRRHFKVWHDETDSEFDCVTCKKKVPYTALYSHWEEHYLAVSFNKMPNLGQDRQQKSKVENLEKIDSISKNKTHKIINHKREVEKPNKTKEGMNNNKNHKIIKQKTKTEALNKKAENINNNKNHIIIKQKRKSEEPNKKTESINNTKNHKIVMQKRKVEEPNDKVGRINNTKNHKIIKRKRNADDPHRKIDSINNKNHEIIKQISKAEERNKNKNSVIIKQNRSHVALHKMVKRRVSAQGLQISTKKLNVLIQNLVKIKGLIDCNICFKQFHRISDMKRHLIEHLVQQNVTSPDFIGTYSCIICKATFDKVLVYKRHMREHASLTLYECQICNKYFSDSSNFAKHKKVHGFSCIQCHLCKRKFNCKNMIMQHMKYHSQNEALHCPKCNCRFYFMSTLTKHMRSHKKPNVKRT